MNSVRTQMHEVRATGKSKETKKPANKASAEDRYANSSWDFYGIWICYCVGCWAILHRGGCIYNLSGLWLTYEWQSPGEGRKEQYGKMTANVKEERVKYRDRKVQLNYCTRLEGWEVHLESYIAAEVRSMQYDSMCVWRVNWRALFCPGRGLGLSLSFFWSFCLKTNQSH